MLVVAAVAPAVGTAVASDGSLGVGVTQADDGTATVTVTHNGSAVQNATVEVSTDNASYAGNGTYQTDENGTVSLPAPEQNVTVTVTATHENATASTTTTLVAPESDDGDDAETFGQKVSEFVHWLHDNGEEFTPGAVAEFVTEHNPGNAPDHAGPKNGTASGNQTAGPGNGHGPGGNNGQGQGNGQANGHDK